MQSFIYPHVCTDRNKGFVALPKEGFLAGIT